MLKPYTHHQDTQKLQTEPQPSQREAETYQKGSQHSLPRNTIIIILPLVAHGCKTWHLTLGTAQIWGGGGGLETC
jgi:hypothetical protein